jgi:hypothetical protein
MAVDVKPGSVVNVTVKKSPTNEAAAKTLSRLFAKDPVHKKARVQRKKLLAAAMDVRRRGGRPWEVRPKAPRLVQPVAGDACTIRATMDVIGDLRSVERFVEVKAAK